MKQVDCLRLDGNLIRIDAGKLSFRPAAYAVLVREGKILLAHMRTTGKYHLPGGGVELGERVEETLHREVLEETGIRIAVNRMVDFEELFFYYDPSGNAYHGLHFYYLCTALTSDLVSDDQVMDGSADRPCWVAVNDLKASDFQHGGEKVLAICRNEMMK